MQQENALQACRVLHLVRITLEAESPLSIGAEESMGQYLHDVALARDANGLLTMPGASLAGVLRHLALESYGPEWVDRVFGWQGEYEDKGQAAKVWFSFGLVHNCRGKAVQGLVPDQGLFHRDRVLGLMRELVPLERDHVAIDHRGTAEENKKFGRVAAPRGTRFSVELAMWGVEGDHETLEALVSLVGHPAFRLGGATRRGYGKVKLEMAGRIALPLSDPQRIRDVRSQPPSDLTGFTNLTLSPPHTAATTAATLSLKPMGPWRIGGGKVARFVDNKGRSADALPLREDWIEWGNGAATVHRASEMPDGKVRLTVTASEVKGALAHRALFHLNRLESGRLIDIDNLPGKLRDLRPAAPGIAVDKAAIDEAIKELMGEDALEDLLGSAKKRDAGLDAPHGRAGVVLIDDVFIDVSKDKIFRVEHNAIDRFTGGVRTGLLFSEEVVFDEGVEIHIPITFLGSAAKVGAKPRWAFGLALQDLCQGRLAIGAKRLGYCEGRVVGADTWLNWAPEKTSAQQPETREGAQ